MSAKTNCNLVVVKKQHCRTTKMLQISPYMLVSWWKMGSICTEIGERWIAFMATEKMCSCANTHTEEKVPTWQYLVQSHSYKRAFCNLSVKHHWIHRKNNQHHSFIHHSVACDWHGDLVWFSSTGMHSPHLLHLLQTKIQQNVVRVKTETASFPRSRS